MAPEANLVALNCVYKLFSVWPELSIFGMSNCMDNHDLSSLDFYICFY